MSMEALERIENEIQHLSLDEQLLLMEHLARQIRTHSAVAQPDRLADLAAMAADPEIQRELRAIEAEFAGTEWDGLREG